jgi:hypothetical protein
MAAAFPSYRELMARKDAPAGSSWGVFGKNDEVGTLNFIDAACIRRASALVKRGAVFNLDHNLQAFSPPLAPHRQNLKHTMFCRSPHHRDDYIDNLYLQGSSQIDGLRHFKHQEHGFYNFVSDDDVDPGSPTIGVNRYAERGIVGRGVLIDIERYLATKGRRLDHRAGEPFPASLLDETAAHQGLRFEPGDILLMRTGWLAWYFNETNPEERATLPQHLRSPGLIQSRDTTAWLWDNRIAVGASDNVGFEAIPSIEASPFVTEADRAAGISPIHAGLMHPTLIALMGLCIGELWDLDPLAEDCARTGVYECMVTAKPLNLTGGVGSPANALAIK